MATVIIAIIVFGIVGADVAYLLYNLVHHTGKFGCSSGGFCSGCEGCSACGGSSACSGNCSECSSGCASGDQK